MTQNENKNTLAIKISLASILTVLVFLFVYLITVLSGSSEFYTQSAEKNAKIYLEEDILHANDLADRHFENLHEIVDRVKNAGSRAEVEAIIESYIGSDKFGDLRYYSGGNAYSANGLHIVEETSGKEYIDALSASSVEGVSPVYYDKNTELNCIAFFVPIRGSEHIDGILSILPARNIVDVGEVMNEKASAVAIIAADGMVLSGAVADGFTHTIGNDFYDFITAITLNSTETAKVSEIAAKGTKEACTISTHEAGYTVAASPLSRFSNHLTIVTVSVSEGLIAPELTYVRHIVNLLIIAMVALVVGFVYAGLYHKKTKRALSVATLIDKRLDCPNAEQFRLSAKDHISMVRRKYSVIVLSIRSYIYFNEQLGEKDSIEALKALAKIIASLSNHQECYGYAGGGKFHILALHANSHAVGDKIKLIETLFNRNEYLAEKGIKVRFAAGVYNVFSGYRRSVQEMVDCATTAATYAEDDTKTLYTLFTEEVKREIEHNEKIEAIMESALANREFKLFLQPKYDVKHDTIHSAEALVRWFDTERGEYKFPGEFIPLFETNGFIVKLDHFVYIEVLEYLSKAAAKGEKVVPIAVNVSRVTAVSPDFINFYVGNKKKYGIPDGFVTLELTESFAMEDYDKISTIITALHNSGMRCSIDDFGSGYSSFSILKQISVDELKLDSVFMKRGVDIARDDKLLETLIGLAKFMGMDVVQEGVETKEMFDKLVGMGCDIIQGYYYARAIPLEEFRVFIKTNTSIKYKSLVK